MVLREVVAWATWSMATGAALSACAAGHSEQPQEGISWSVDIACERRSDKDVAAVGEAIALWADGFDVEIVPDDPDRATQVLICFSDDRVLDSSGEPVNGLTSRTSPGAYRIAVDRWAVRFAGRFYGALLAHELGHVILPGSGDEDHLPPGRRGIMSPAHDCVADGPLCAWSEADVQHDLARAGLLPACWRVTPARASSPAATISRDARSDGRAVDSRRRGSRPSRAG